MLCFSITQTWESKAWRSRLPFGSLRLQGTFSCPALHTRAPCRPRAGWGWLDRRLGVHEGPPLLGGPLLPPLHPLSPPSSSLPLHASPTPHHQSFRDGLASFLPGKPVVPVWTDLLPSVVDAPCRGPISPALSPHSFASPPAREWGCGGGTCGLLLTSRRWQR